MPPGSGDLLEGVPGFRRLRRRPGPRRRARLRGACRPPESCRPPSSPNCDTKPVRLFAMSGHDEVSLSRPISRITREPEGVALARSRTAAARTGSGTPPSIPRRRATRRRPTPRPSSGRCCRRRTSSGPVFTPAAFTANSYAVRRSWYESMTTRIQSDGDGRIAAGADARRSSPAPCRRRARPRRGTSRRTRPAPRCRTTARAPSRGSRWTNSVMGTARSQAAFAELAVEADRGGARHFGGLDARRRRGRSNPSRAARPCPHASAPRAASSPHAIATIHVVFTARASSASRRDAPCHWFA